MTEPTQEPTQTPPEQQPGPVPYDRFQAVIAERNEARVKLQEVETAQQKAREEAAKAAGEFERLYNESKPKLDVLAQYEGAVDAMLKARLEAVPEAMRALVPDGTPLQKLTWLEQATAAGLFHTEQQPPRAPGVPPRGPAQPPAPTITKAQMGNPAWVREHADEIRQAAKEGRLER